MFELFVVTIIPIGSINAMWRFLPEEKGNNINKIIILMALNSYARKIGGFIFLNLMFNTFVTL